MALPLSLYRYREIKNWESLFECDSGKYIKELEKPTEIKWSDWQPVPKGSFIEGWDFETNKNRKMFFIMSGRVLEQRYIIV